MLYKKLTVFFAVIILLNTTMIFAQKFTSVNSAQSEMYLKNIQSTSVSMQTMECEFIQIQTIAALSLPVQTEGRMFYRKSDCMKWEYLKPDNYCFVVNRGKVVMKRNGKTSQNSSVKMFARISKMILSGISGKDIVDTKNFNSSYSLDGDLFRITLVPKSSGMQRVISSIIMDFDMKQNFISAMEIIQIRNVTRIEFKNKKINIPIAETEFAL